MRKEGAYILYLHVTRSLTLRAGSLESVSLSSGHYVYIGSARRSMAARISRHRRLAEKKTGKLHWHVDYLLAHPRVRLIGEKTLAGGSECAVSKRIASKKGVRVPIPHFGSSDCKSGCPAHLYQIG